MMRRTDLCETCRTMELLIQDLRRRGARPELSEEEKEFIQLWCLHDDESHIQREAMHFDLDELAKDEVLIIADFKENFKLAYTWSQVGREWYNRHQISCLTFLCYKRNSNGEIHKIPVTYLSEILKHTGSYVLHCFHQLLSRQDVMKDIKRVIWWSDHGPHFFCKEVLAGISRECDSYDAVSINFFCPCHGKSEVDGIFGVLQQLLDACLPSTGVYTLDELVKFFRDQSTNLALNHPQEHISYVFESFATLFLSFSTHVFNRPITPPFRREISFSSALLKCQSWTENLH